MKYFAAGSHVKLSFGRSSGSRWFPGRPIALTLLGSACLLVAGLPIASAAILASPMDDVADSAKAGESARAVRLSSADGHVQVLQDGQIIADPALANQPLFEGSQIVTGADGRAEVQLEDGSVARLSPNTTLTFSVLQQQGTGTRTEVVLNSGLAYFELQPSNAEHSLRVNYGTASFSASSFSVVRLLEDAPPGDVAVFSGNIHLERGDQLKLDIHGGESLALNATDPNQYNLAETIAPDSWDSWNSDRDQVLNAESADKTGATAGLGDYQTVGLNDLDANGNWYNVPDQGYIWSPFEAQAGGAGWDPYGFGHWVYYPGRGYVWVSGYGWGYAPFQCGTWDFFDTIGWGWAPGGGCNPWGGFGAGWYGGGGWYNVGRLPHGYHPPKRPLPLPIRPRTGPGGPGRRPIANPVLVDRRPAEKIGLPPAGRSTEPVMIAGHTVQPLRPLAPRQAYTGSATSFVNHSGTVVTGYAGAGHTVYSGVPGSGASGVVGRQMPVQGGARTYTPGVPVSHSSLAPSHASAPSGGGGSHVSSGGGGGGGGGGGHASGGGGGGGGGGSHK